jgi:hypothetical protein
MSQNRNHFKLAKPGPQAGRRQLKALYNTAAHSVPQTHVALWCTASAAQRAMPHINTTHQLPHINAVKTFIG